LLVRTVRTLSIDKGIIQPDQLVDPGLQLVDALRSIDERHEFGGLLLASGQQLLFELRRIQHVSQQQSIGEQRVEPAEVLTVGILVRRPVDGELLTFLDAAQLRSCLALQVGDVLPDAITDVLRGHGSAFQLFQFGIGLVELLADGCEVVTIDIRFDLTE
jgi:hypothetical protein